MVQNWSTIGRGWSQSGPGHFWGTSGKNHFFSKTTPTNHETSTGPKTDFVQNTSGHESPNMASKINVLQQKSPPRAKLFGSGVIDP